MSLRIGLVGLGVISAYYLRALDRLEGIELAAACDRDPARLEPFAGRAKRYADHRELLADADVDAVVVVVPNDAHAEVCSDALAAGRAVCVEKPLATSLADAERLAAMADERGLVLLTAFHRRYNDNVLALAAGLRDAPAIRRATVRYFERIEDHAGPDSWYLDPARCGGGCVADNGPNALDLVHLLLGDVELVDADVVRDHHGIDRQAAIELVAASGATARVELDWSYGQGERKDVRVELADGSVRHADMLAGHHGFKASLDHEYVAVLAELRDAVAGRVDRWPRGVAALRLVTDVYAHEAAGGGDHGCRRAPHELKRAVGGSLVKLLTHRRFDRGMTVEAFASRCVRRGELHELVTTDAGDPAAGARVDHVGFVGFVEIETAGVIDRGDEVWIGDARVGTVLGFDGCHFPNHYNVLIRTDRPRTGLELGAPIGAAVRFEPAR
ncbi:MAG: Gfo/Idh/MocA family protein [Frankiaceae bacterium]